MTVKLFSRCFVAPSHRRVGAAERVAHEQNKHTFLAPRTRILCTHLYNILIYIYMRHSTASHKSLKVQNFRITRFVVSYFSINQNQEYII